MQVRSVSHNHHAQLRRVYDILFFASLCFSFIIYLGLWHTPLLAKTWFWPSVCIHDISQGLDILLHRTDMGRLVRAAHYVHKKE